MTNLELYTDAILTVDLPSKGLRTNDVGTIIELHEAPGVAEIGYSVEFSDMTRQTVSVVTVPASHLRAPTSSDVPSVRSAAPSIE
jgi:hypothetical protein